MSHNEITDVVQDDKGFIWIGTTYGLNRYDGSDIITYYHQRDNPDSLVNNYVWDMYKGKNDTLWISTFGGGLSRLDLKKGQFTNYVHDPGDPESISGNRVWSVLEDRKGRVWATTESGLSLLNPETGHFKNYHLSGNKGTVNHTTIIEDHQGLLWFGSYGHGLYRFNPETEQFTNYTDRDGLISNSVTTVYEDSQHTLWIGTADGLDHFIPEQKRFTHHQSDTEDPNSLSNNFIWSVHEATSGKLWLGTEGGGLNIFDPDTKQFTRYQPSPHDPNSISGSGVTFINQDDNGLYWVSTYGGLDIYNPERTLFTTYQQQKGIADEPNNNDILSIFQDKAKQLWLGTNGGGLKRVHPETGIVSHYLNHDNQAATEPGAHSVGAIHKSRNGLLWLGTDKGLIRFDPATNRLHTYKLPEGGAASSIFAITGGKDDTTLWLGGSYLYRFDTRTETFKSFPYASTHSNGTATGWVYSLLRDDKNHIWIGTDSGLSHLNPDTGIFTNYYPDPKQQNSLSNGFIQSLYQDSNGTLWIGTNDGLNRFDPASGHFQHYFEQDGISGNRISAITEDNQGNLWLATNKGISQFDTVTDTFKNYDQRDGLRFRQANTGAIFKNEAGILYFGSPQGLSFFNPEQLTTNQNPPQVVLTQFSLSNQIAEKTPDSPVNQEIAYIDSITLTHQQNIFGFEFAALNFWAPAKNRYAYQLEGFDKEWIYTDSNQRHATYTNIDAGTYTFRVKAANNDGVWNETGTAIGITILPPWWQTYWFRTLVLTLIIATAILFYYWRMRAITSKNKQLQKEVQKQTHELLQAGKAKDEFIATMNHELRTPMNAIVGLGNLLGLEKLPATQATYVQRLNIASRHMMQIISNVLDFSKTGQPNFTVDEKPFQLNIALHSVHQLLLQQAQQKGLQLHLDNQTDKSLVVMGDRTRLAQVLNNLLTNAIRYTADGEVTLCVSQIDKTSEETADKNIMLRFSVQDTGPGIPATQFETLFEPFKQLNNSSGSAHREGIGLGLPISKKLLEHMGGNLIVRSQQDFGSEFYFELVMPLASAIETARTNEQQLTEFRLPPGCRILLVDDSEANRFVGTEMLQNMGASVGQANSGKHAILQLQQHTYDLVLLDISMPDIDGLEVTRWIRQHSRTPKLPVIALTAHALGDVQKQCQEAGMDDFISKPFEYQALYQVIERHLPMSDSADSSTNKEYTTSCLSTT
ncbi:MAG: two-component regulator propeller domain-containing protein [Thiolinea sp.]